tara:strand:+ start:528 stop:914 length:387 start_codon:yes stop_codon:yes gene_type:complete
MTKNIFQTNSIFENHDETNADTERNNSTPEQTEHEQPKSSWKTDPLTAWKAVQASTTKRLYVSDPLVRDAIDRQMAREQNPKVQSTPPKDQIIGYTEDGKIYAKRAASTDAERMQMMAAIRKAYSETS